MKKKREPDLYVIVIKPDHPLAKGYSTIETPNRSIVEVWKTFDDTVLISRVYCKQQKRTT